MRISMASLQCSTMLYFEKARCLPSKRLIWRKRPLPLDPLPPPPPPPPLIARLVPLQTLGAARRDSLARSLSVVSRQFA